MKKITLQSKLVLSFVFLMTILLLCQLGFNLFFAEEYYIYQTSQTMQKAYEELKLLYDGDIESIEDTLLFYEDNYNIDIKISTSEGELFYETSNRFDFRPGPSMHPPQNTPAEAVSVVSQSEMEAQQSDDSQPGIVVQERGGSQDSATFLLNLWESFEYQDQSIVVFMLLTLSSIENSVGVLSNASMIITVAVLILGLLLFFILSKSITKPIKDMQVSTEHIAKLDFSMPVKETQSAAELSALAHNINSMSHQLKSAIDELHSDIENQKKVEKMRREFVAAVSHEMKTPLALLQIYAENLKENIDTLDKEEYCTVISEESARLSEMVSSMLKTSAMENGLFRHEGVPLSLSCVCEEYIEKISPMTIEYNFTSQIEKDITVNGSEEHLQQAIKNYISNAMEHTKKGGEIKVKLYKQDGNAVFSVFNKGSYLAEKDRPHIWTGFYRSDDARVRKNGNIGMGLHIVKTVVERHKGKVSAENQDGGVMFSFTIPL